MEYISYGIGLLRKYVYFHPTNTTNQKSNHFYMWVIEIG